MTTALKLMTAQDWTGFRARGAYAGSAVDRADGYIHMSTDAQVAETARRHYAGQVDLVLLTVALDGLGCALTWEPSRGGDLFPHLYADLPLSTVTEGRALSVDANGAMTVGDRLWP